MSAASDPCTPLTVESGDGAAVRFCAHGGHVLGWAPAGGTDRLWLSRDTGCGDGVAIRGGVPVIWPQFSDRGPGPRHGVARDRAWQVMGTGTDDSGVAAARLRLTGDAGTTPFPHAFALHLEVRASGSTLDIELTARNDGTDDLTMTAALHSYLRVASTTGTRVTGLEGLLARPNDGQPAWPVYGPIQVVGPLDVAVEGVAEGEAGAVVVDDGTSAPVTLTVEGFDSRVVWNPGPGRAPGDVHAGGEAEFVCVEPALLTPLTLAPGRSWRGRQTLSVG